MPAVEMYGDHSLGARRNRGLELMGSHIVIVAHIDQDGRGAGMNDGRNRGYESVAHGDDFIASANPCRE